jgi:phage recombination protein Bet
MTEAIQTTNQQERSIMRPEDIQILVNAGVIPQGTPAPQVALFAKYCGDSGLSPFKRQVHLIKRSTKSGDRYTIQTGIDGYRSIADRTGRYAGNDDYVFNEGVSLYDASKSAPAPLTATATVYKLVGGVRCPSTASARWSEYAPPDDSREGFLWRKMPFLMLGKCAEALALRKAFPDELGGLYTDEEMHQASAMPVDVRQIETVNDNGEVSKTDQPKQAVAENVSLNTFDPQTELVGFGKYKGMEWAKLPVDYLKYITSGANGPNKNKAEATLKLLEAADQQKADPFDEVFDQSKQEPVQQGLPLFDTLEFELADVVHKFGDKKSIKLWAENAKVRIKTLTEEQQETFRKAYLHAMKEAS